MVKQNTQKKIESGKYGLISPDEPSFGDNIEMFKIYTDVKKDDFVLDGVLLNVTSNISE